MPAPPAPAPAPAPVPAAESSKRSASAKKGWETRRLKAAARALELAKTQTQSQSETQSQAQSQTQSQSQAQSSQKAVETKPVTSTETVVTETVVTETVSVTEKVKVSVNKVKKRSSHISSREDLKSEEATDAQSSYTDSETTTIKITRKRKTPPSTRNLVRSGTKKSDADEHRDTALIRAIATGDTGTAVDLLECVEGSASDGEAGRGSIDVNAVNMHGTTALMQAVKSTNITFVNQLLNISDVDVNMEDVWCHTALVWAVYKADMDTILLLMKQDGINVDKALIVAAFYGYEDLITLFLSEVKDVNVNATDRHGNTALLCAIQNNTEGTDKEIIVDLLLKNPNLNVNVINKYGDSTLIQAVRARNYHLVESLLFHPSCDTNGLGFIEHRDIHGVDAFTWALHCNCLDIASLIAEHHMELATVSQQRSPADFLGASYCKTALTSSIVSLLRRQYDELRAKNDSEAVQVSPQSAHETSPTQNVNITGVDTWDFLFCDTIFNKHIVSHLLTREDLQVNKFDQNGCSALTWSMTHQNERLVRILLDRPDVLVNKADTAGFTPLMLACRDGYVKFAELIARREDIFVNIRGGPDGKTAIQLALDNEHMEIGSRLAKRNDIELEVVFRNAIESSNDTIVRLLLDNMPAGRKRKDNLIDIMLELAVRCAQDVVATDSRINSRYDSADSIVQLLSKECSVKEKNDTRATAVKNDDSRCEVHVQNVYMSPSKIISWFCVLVLLAGFIMYHYGYSTFDEYMKL